VDKETHATDWLAQELNNLYSVPRKTAPDWVKGNKLLLLLDGLDEVRQDSRAKCVEAINAFRKEHGMTSLAVCSRSQDYADLNSKLSFEGAIEVQPLTQKQITEYFNHFGKKMAGIKQVLKKDSALCEMAETPLLLSIMVMAYRDKQDTDILMAQDKNSQRRHLFDTYIERMFERPHSKSITLKKQDVLHWLSWLANKMTEHNQAQYSLENMQPMWLPKTRQVLLYKLTCVLILGLSIMLSIVLMFGVRFEGVVAIIWQMYKMLRIGLYLGFVYEVILEANKMIHIYRASVSSAPEIYTIDSISLNWGKLRKSLLNGLFSVVILGLIGWLIIGLIRLISNNVNSLLIGVLIWLIVNIQKIIQIIIDLINRLYYAVNELITGILDIQQVTPLQKG